MLVFEFTSLRKPPNAEDVVADIEVSAFAQPSTHTPSPPQISFICDLLSKSKRARDRRDVLNMVTSSDKFMHVAQAKQLLSECNESSERVQFVSQAMYRLVSKDGEAVASELLNLLSPSELAELNGMMSESARNFSASNPTGHYRLDLGRESDRCASTAGRVSNRAVRSQCACWSSATSSSLPVRRGLLQRGSWSATRRRSLSACCGT